MRQEETLLEGGVRRGRAACSCCSANCCSCDDVVPRGAEHRGYKEECAAGNVLCKLT